MDVNQILEDWKKEYGNIFLTDINDQQFIFKLLSYEEYDEIIKNVEDSYDMDEAICRVAVLDPEVKDWEDEIFAGYVSTLSQLIREESLIIPRAENKENSDNQVIELLEEKGQQIANSFMMQLPIIIVHTFPQYTFEDVGKMSLYEQVDLYAKANWALENLAGIELSFDSEE